MRVNILPVISDTRDLKQYDESLCGKMGGLAKHLRLKGKIFGKSHIIKRSRNENEV